MPLPFTTTLLAGISLVITQFCPIVTLFPIFTEPIIFVPAPIKTLSPIVAAPHLGVYDQSEHQDKGYNSFRL